MKPATFLQASALALLFVFSHSSFAALGGDFASVQADQAHMKATIRSSQAQAYMVHEMESPGHVLIREYVSPQGKVFGVAWNGQFRPDLRQVLGDYYGQYSQAVETKKAAQHGRSPLSISQPGLFVEMTGHMRAFSGRAYVPDMLPQGVRAEEVR